jgi:hypothetical protein
LLIEKKKQIDGLFEIVNQKGKAMRKHEEAEKTRLVRNFWGDNFVYLACTPNFWGMGKDEKEAVREIKKAGGSSRLRDFGYDLYLAHPETEVDPVHGDFIFPINREPVRIANRLKKKK